MATLKPKFTRLLSHVIGRLGCLALVSLIVTAGAARAEDEEESFRFKLPAAGSKKAPEPEPKAEPSEVPYVPPISVQLGLDQPEYSVRFLYQPSAVAVSQQLKVGSATATDFNLSSLSALSFGIGGTAELSRRFWLDGEVGIARYSTSAVTGSLFSIKDSSITAVRGYVAPLVCFSFLSRGNLKICPGVGIGIDAFPILRFETPSELVFYTSNNMVIKGLLQVRVPLGDSISLRMTGGFDYGLGKGNSFGVSQSKLMNFYGRALVATPFFLKSELLFGMGADLRSSTFVQDVDTWAVANLFISGTLGLGYRF